MRLKNYFKVIICLLALMLAGSITFAAKKKNSKVPDWVTSPTSVYPSSSLFSYVGYGNSRSEAEIQAVNGLAAIFGQSVKSDSAAAKRMAQAKMNGKVATASVSTFSQDILRSVDVSNLVGVEIAEFWFDEDKTWYAIAVLDKDKGKNIYSDMIVKNYKAIEELLSNTTYDYYSLETYIAYDFACDIAIENEDHLRKLSVINPSVVPSLKAYVPSSKEIGAQKTDIAKNIPICVIISGDENGHIASTYTEALASCGFRGTLDSRERYILTGQVEFEESESSDKKTTKCRYKLDSYILDTETGQQIVPFNVKGRDAHKIYSEAKNRSLKAIDQKIKTEFPKKFEEYLKAF